jgi:acetyl-CoA carboxylase carboxyl transferase subunit beta
MSWLQKLLPPRSNDGRRAKGHARVVDKCPACDAVLYSTDLEKNQNVCPKCSHHQRIGARERLDALLDPDGRYEIGAEVLPIDSLKFKDTRKYPERLSVALEETGETDALVVMQGSIKSFPLVVAVFEFDFMGGSMGSVVGERFVRGVRVAYESRVPFVCFTASGGARMQEGVSSLSDGRDDRRAAGVVKLGCRFDGADRSDDGWRVRGFRDDRRHRIAEPGALIGFVDRASSTRRPRKTAGRLPARRVPAGEGRDRHDRRPPAVEGRVAEAVGADAARGAAQRLILRAHRVRGGALAT